MNNENICTAVAWTVVAAATAGYVWFVNKVADDLGRAAVKGAENAARDIAGLITPTPNN